MDELEKLVAFMNRFPALRKAFTRMQSTFGDVAEPTDDDLAFITRVRGAPLQIWGCLQRNGRWLITSYLVPTAAKNEDATEAAIADLTAQKSWFRATSGSPRRWSGSLYQECWPETSPPASKRSRSSRAA